MTSEKELQLREIKQYVKTKMMTVDAGHDWSHIVRVVNNAIAINTSERADDFLVQAGALLHDISDEKLFDKHAAEKELLDFLKSINLNKAEITILLEIIDSVSFGANINQDKELSLEQKVVRDADRLDALGAIGIARTFHYGGSKNRLLFNQNIPPQKYQTKEEYRNSDSPTINHFYEKLLKLKDTMETVNGKAIAHQRHEYMLGFLKQFFSEIGEEGFIFEM